MSKPIVIRIDCQNPVPVQEFICMVLLLAIKDKAANVCFEPEDDKTRITYEVDGIVHELPSIRLSTFHVVCEFMLLAKLGLAYRPLPILRRYLRRLRGDRILPPLERFVKLVFGESTVDAHVSLQHLGPVDPIN